MFPMGCEQFAVYIYTISTEHSSNISLLFSKLESQEEFSSGFLVTILAIPAWMISFAQSKQGDRVT